MSLFRKIFGIKSDDDQQHIKNDDRSKYMPEVKIPIDEMFTINFKANGGKFLYCENLNEVYESIDNILTENNWETEKALVIDDNLKSRFNNSNLIISSSFSDSIFFLTTCENLIATDGSLLISSNQIAEKRLVEFPENFIVFATTSQIVSNIGDGLKGIKNKNSACIPTNITTIKHFKSPGKSTEDKDFMTYGRSSKNLYLLLLEDL